MGGSCAGRTALLLATVLLGACGAAATGDPAVEPEDPGPAEQVPADRSDPADRGLPPAEAVEPPPPQPQQAAQATPPPEPEPVEVEPAPPAEPPPPPGDGHLRIGRPEMARGSGRINGNLFARAIERKRGGMLTCYNVPLGADPELRGNLVMVLVVDPQGMVGVRTEEDDEALAAAGVTSCVEQKLRQVSFSETPPGSELWVRVPLEFKP
jgi:hypothetical protein